MRKKIIAYDKYALQTYSSAESGEMTQDKIKYVNAFRNGIIDYGGYLVTPMLTGAAQRLLSFILIDMDEVNEFATHKKKRQAFVDYLNDLTGSVYKIDYVSRLLVELKDTGFILKECQGVYFVNPLMYWCGLDKDRAIKIEYMLNPANIEIDYLAAIALNNQVIELLSR